MAATPRDWWGRAALLAKDKRSLYLIKLSGTGAGGGGAHHHRRQEIEAAVILATSHDDRSLDYKNAGRVFAWARASSSELLAPIMWCLARRVGNTRSWVVALKCLLLLHGILLCADETRYGDTLGRLPFDLSDFKDRRSSSNFSRGFSAFVRAYFRFLDHRSLFASLRKDSTLKITSSTATTVSPTIPADGYNLDVELEHVERLQILLDLLMQIRPNGDGMWAGLILEAMDCVVIEVFEVYSGICNAIARFLVELLDVKKDDNGREVIDENLRRRRGTVAVRILRRSKTQCSQLDAYFDLCRSLGVLNDAKFPPVERIPDEDIDELERLIVDENKEHKESNESTPPPRPLTEAVEKSRMLERQVEEISKTMITYKWVVFEDGEESLNFLIHSPEKSPAVTSSESWTVAVNSGNGGAQLNNGNLIDLL